MHCYQSQGGIQTSLLTASWYQSHQEEEHRAMFYRKRQNRINSNSEWLSSGPANPSLWSTQGSWSMQNPPCCPERTPGSCLQKTDTAVGSARGHRTFTSFQQRQKRTHWAWNKERYFHSRYKPGISYVGTLSLGKQMLQAHGPFLCGWVGMERLLFPKKVTTAAGWILRALSHSNV